ncbi:hypothetical protein KJ980_01690 [Patescibacteria group bacterium]|nr:hypothetical protein [Patescibacteria group bacterium]MBU4016891.1 hypothetical protein [Patescibacteria group bacterium]MBU4098340.1 hypothetical protein [Patescibacteria group bacterium]
MYNWNTNITELKKNPESYAIWKLEQLINFGLDGERIEKRELVKYWDKIHIDSQKRKVLAFWLWQKQS